MNSSDHTIGMISGIIEEGKFSFEFPVWNIAICFLFAFTITYIVIPSIVKFSKEKFLFDSPNERKSHTSAIPTLGGSAVFLGMIIPVTLFGETDFDHSFKYLIAGLLILFFIGVKDDILVISAKKKLYAEIFAIFLIVVLGDIRLTNFHGFLGIHEIPYLVSVLFSIFMIVVIINGFNLIDGIDGLAASVGILTLSCLGAWFIFSADYSNAAFCFSGSGALLAFLRFNLFSKRNKIFLGDTGSLIIGLVLSVEIIFFLEESLINPVADIYFSAPALAIGLLIIPLTDTLRVFTLRVIAGKSPFIPDRSHTHHQLLDLGISHIHSTLIILVLNLLILVISILFRHLGNVKLLLIIIPMAVIGTSIPGVIIRYRQKAIIQQSQLLGVRTWLFPVTIINLITNRYSKKKR